MDERKWHKGPPPHIGWWNASWCCHIETWRWWNGRHWSRGAEPTNSTGLVVASAKERAPIFEDDIEWTDYWPENARVPRLDPRKKP